MSTTSKITTKMNRRPAPLGTRIRHCIERKPLRVLVARVGVMPTAYIRVTA